MGQNKSKEPPNEPQEKLTGRMKRKPASQLQSVLSLSKSGKKLLRTESQPDELNADVELKSNPKETRYVIIFNLHLIYLVTTVHLARLTQVEVKY